MTKGRQLKTVTVAILVGLLWTTGKAGAAQCGSTAAGFEAWKRQFADEARGKGVSASSLAALMAANYATATIAADRNQGSMRLSLDQFLARRGGSAIAAQGRAHKQSNAALFASIQQRYGVPPGPLLAIWGMETGFVTLIDRGILSAGTRGSMHGEIGHTQFLPKNILTYGAGGSLDNSASALTATANFLKGHGWRAGAGYQPGEANFAAIQAWNAAPVYQQAIALIGRQIDGGEGISAR